MHRFGKNLKIARHLADPFLLSLMAFSILFSTANFHQTHQVFFNAAFQFTLAMMTYGIFIFAWNTRHKMESTFFLTLCVAFFYLGLLNFLLLAFFPEIGILPLTRHSLSVLPFLGMQIQLLESGAFLAAACLSRRKTTPAALFTAFAVAAALAAGPAFLGPGAWQKIWLAFPRIAGLHVNSLLTAGVFAAALIRLFQQRGGLGNEVFGYLLLAIAADLTATVWADRAVPSHFLPGGVMAGKIAFLYFLYRSMLGMGLTRPMEQMYLEIKKSQEQFSTFMDHLPAGVFIKDASHNYIFINKYMREKVLAEKWLGKNAFDFFPPDVAERIRSDEQEVLRFEEKIRATLIPDSQGRERLFEIYKFPIPWRGRKTYIGCVALDITERWKIETELHESELRFRQILQNVSIMVFTQDKNLLYTRFYNYPRGTQDEVNPPLGKSDLEIYPEAEARPLMQFKLQVLESCQPARKEFQLTVEGQVRRIDLAVEPNFDSEGLVSGITCVSLDVTERKHMEEALRESESRFRLAVDNYPATVIIYDAEMKIQFINAFGIRESGRRREELLGRTEEELRPTLPVGGHRDILLKTFETRATQSTEVHLTHKNRDYHMSIIYVPLLDEGGRVKQVFGLFHDISRLKQAELLLERDKQTLEKLVVEGSQKLFHTQLQLEKAKRLSDIGVLAASVAHELRNPLSVIQTATFNLRRKLGDRSLDHHLNHIDKKIAESNQIINNLLNYSRIRMPTYEKADLRSMLEDCLATSRSRFQPNQVEIHFDIPENLDRTLEVDIFQIRETFNNIVVNAFQAFAELKGRLEIRVRENQPGTLTIAFIDNGCGIEEHNLPYLFEPFFTTKRKGTGLGLALCYEMVHLHGGEITVESSLGQGTTVTLQLPRARRQAAALGS